MAKAAREMLARALQAPGSPEAVLAQTRGMLKAEIALSRMEGVSEEYLREWQELLTLLETLGPARMLEMLGR